MCIKNSNSAMHVLVLARPADSMCVMLTASLNQWGQDFSVYSTVYEVVNTVKEVPAGLPFILVVRPVMLGIRAALYMNQVFPNVRMIGWMDPDEDIPNYMITQMTINGMVLVSRLDQLQQAIGALCRTVPQIEPTAETAVSFPDEPDRLEYELSDDEVNALLGVE